MLDHTVNSSTELARSAFRIELYLDELVNLNWIELKFSGNSLVKILDPVHTSAFSPENAYFYPFQPTIYT